MLHPPTHLTLLNSLPTPRSMARLDKVKNLTGLAEWYGANTRLRGLVNLVVVGACAWCLVVLGGNSGVWGLEGRASLDA